MNQTDLICITPDEKQRIGQWIEDNNCDPFKGIITLEFSFWIFGAAIDLEYQCDRTRHRVNIREDETSLPEKTVSCLNIRGLNLPLEVPESFYTSFISRSQAITTAHIDETCEPPGSTILLEIDHNGGWIKAFAQEALIASW